MNMEKIDFVLPWVDGSDPAWLAEKRRYESGGAAVPCAGGEANADCRYRDCGHCNQSTHPHGNEIFCRFHGSATFLLRLTHSIIQKRG